jgi:hypothetical protein
MIILPSISTEDNTYPYAAPNKALKGLLDRYFK